MDFNDRKQTLKNRRASILDVASDRTRCYGCGACANACRSGAVRMGVDGYGFLRPEVDSGACTGCGACRSACPRLSPDYSNREPEHCYALMADDGIRKKSSTGGVFTLLADYILDRGGVVFGAELSGDFLVRHTGIEAKQDLDRLRGSKYAQSDVGMTYREARSALDSGRPVLYCGCPCQIAGLKSFLGRDYDNLVTVDLLCGGNPSAYNLRQYLDDMWGLENITGMRFRGLEGWDFRFEVFLKSGGAVRDPGSAYMKAYLKHALNKPSCGTCQFDRLPRQGDFTIGDFWNVKTLDAAMDDGLGTSVMLANNAKAGRIWGEAGQSRIKSMKTFSVDDAYRSGVGYIKVHPSPFPGQDEFDRTVASKGFTAAVRESSSHYDVGIAGTWLANYGTFSTNMALYRTIRSLGLTACILDVTGDKSIDGRHDISSAFIRAKGIPRASAFCPTGDYNLLNRHCDMFVTASDQLWNRFAVYTNHADYVYLGFADDGKKLVAAGTSIGSRNVSYSQEELDARRGWLARFDRIGVREDFGPSVLESMYGVRSEHIQDPVFLCDGSSYVSEASNATFRPAGPFVFAYMIYEPWDSQLFEFAKKFAAAMGVGVIMCRGLGPGFREYDKDLNLVKTHDRYYRNWCRCMTEASYVLTNSFHGVCVSMVLEKDFIHVPGQGLDRFGCLARDFGIGDRLLQPADGIDIGTAVNSHVDYGRIRPIMAYERRRGLSFLRSALLGEPRQAMKPSGQVLEDFRDSLQECQGSASGSGYMQYLKGIPEPDLFSSILVEIPAYNDPDVVNTVLAARRMAANPDRVSFAVCLQDDDMGKLEALEAIPGCRVKHYPAADAPGGCAARYQCQRLYQGEDFVLHTDAHMRFAKGWDVALLDQWARCHDGHAVLSGYPDGFGRDMLRLDPGDGRFTELAGLGGRLLAPAYFPRHKPSASLRAGCVPFDGPDPVQGALISAALLFCRGEDDGRVLVDPEMHFFGDEMGMCVRYWTHGYNIYQPGVSCVFHLYANDRAGAGYPNEFAARRRSDLAMTGDGITRDERERRRMETLLGVRKWPDVDLGDFGLGTARTLAAYQAFCGVDFRKMAIYKYGYLGKFGRPNDVPGGMALVNWERVYQTKGQGNQYHGRALDVQLPPDVADRFEDTCTRHGWDAGAALADAVRSWADSEDASPAPGTASFLSVQDFQQCVRDEKACNGGAGYLDYLQTVKDPDLASTILLEIPAYCDSEILNTVNAARLMAMNPDRIKFAVCLQDDDMAKLDALNSIPGCRVKHYAKADAPGTCAARHDCQLMYGGEDFVLHLDSHMRFARFWDVALIDRWRACGSEKAVLSDYCYDISDENLAKPVDDPVFTRKLNMCAGVVNAFYFQSYSPELRMHVPKQYSNPGGPMRGALVSAHCMFGRPDMDRIVPVDPKMDFVADESSIAARLWTHGFDIWHSDARVVYHMYARQERPNSTYVKWSSQTMTDDGITRNERQLRRLEKLLGMYDRQDVDLSGYDLGTERSLAAYQEYAGVDFKNLRIRKFAHAGRFDVPHSGKDMDFVDWRAVYKNRHKRSVPEAGSKLEVRIRPDAASGFLDICRKLDLTPSAALTEAVREWSDRKLKGRF